jgi:hypothetical protein
MQSMTHLARKPVQEAGLRRDRHIIFSTTHV